MHITKTKYKQNETAFSLFFQNEKNNGYIQIKKWETKRETKGNPHAPRVPETGGYKSLG